MTNNVTTLKTGGAIGAIIPQSIEEVFRIATAVAKSGLAPPSMNTAEKLTVAIMHGMEIGLPPMQSIQKIAVVNGRPTLWGDAVPALLWARGFKLREWEDETTSYCEITRPGGEKIVRSFSDDDARTAGLLGKAGPWKQYPKRMRQMRARGFCSRDGAPDALSGMYLAEEIQDEEATAPKSAHRARKDGDFDTLKSGIDACVSEAAIDSYLLNQSELINKLPRSWHEHLDDHLAIARKRLSAVTIEPVDEEPDDETVSARQSIKDAISLEMLAHLRSVFPDASWEDLAAEYDAKAEELQARQP